MKVNFINDTKYKLDYKDLKSNIKSVLKDLLLKKVEVTFRFITDNEIVSFNKKYFSVDSYTDVIAFPDNVTSFDGKNTFLGDILISLDTVSLNAEKYNCSFLEELFRVIVHGILHLIGYKDDTNDDKKKMILKQEIILKKILGVDDE